MEQQPQKYTQLVKRRLRAQEREERVRAKFSARYRHFGPQLVAYTSGVTRVGS